MQPLMNHMEGKTWLKREKNKYSVHKKQLGAKMRWLGRHRWIPQWIVCLFHLTDHFQLRTQTPGVKILAALTVTPLWVDRPLPTVMHILGQYVQQKQNTQTKKFCGPQVTGWIQALTCHLGSASHESSLRTVACGFPHHLTHPLGRRPSTYRLPMSRSLCKWEGTGLHLLHHNHGSSFSVVFNSVLVRGAQCRQGCPPWTILLWRYLSYSSARQHSPVRMMTDASDSVA